MPRDPRSYLEDIVWGIIESDLVSLHDCANRLLNASW